MTKMSTSQTNIRVVIRVRPFNRQELEQNQRNIIRVLDESNLIFDPEDDNEEFFFHGVKQTHRDLTKRVRKKMNMEFDSIFDWDAKNEEIFKIATLPLVERLMSGYNCSVFVYGATGAGKTYTMLGNPDTPGITFLTMKTLFESIEQLKETRKFDIGISYLEVYNERVMNLLSKSGPLNLREDGNGVTVSGLVLKKIDNATELLDLLAEGNRNRTQHPTDANAESSRSHAIFQVHIRMTDKKTSQKKMVKLSMIDLAGSERAASTQCTGIRFKEGANINKSLLALGNCINRLADGSKYVPYRDSKLTRILKDSLGGNCQTVMIANISPSSLTYEDTYNTLKYASRAKKIKTSLRENVLQSNIPKEYLIKKVGEQQIENDKLIAKIKELEKRLAESESRHINSKPIVAHADTTSSSPVNSQLDLWTNKIDTVFEQLRLTQEKYFNIMSKEKTLACRKKLKLYLESIRNVFKTDEINEEISGIEASIDKSSKLLLKQKEDMQQWAIRHKDTINTLETLKKEISDSGSNLTVNLYVENKELELINHKTQLKTTHMQKITSIYSTEFEHWKHMTSTGFGLLNEFYLLLRSSGVADKEMQDQISKLIKLCQGRQKKVKFFEENEQENVKESNADLSFGTMPSITESPVDQEDDSNVQSSSSAVLSNTTSGKKRPNSDAGGLDDGKGINKVAKTSCNTYNFVKPKAVKAINFNNVPGSSSSSSLNSKSTTPNNKNVFKVPTVEPIQMKQPSLNETHTIMSNSDALNATFDMDPRCSNVLSENGINIKDSIVFDKMKNITKAKLIKNAAISFNKENKRFTPRKIVGKMAIKSTIQGGSTNGASSKARVKPLHNTDRFNKGGLSK